MAGRGHAGFQASQAAKAKSMGIVRAQPASLGGPKMTAAKAPPMPKAIRNPKRASTIAAGSSPSAIGANAGMAPNSMQGGMGDDDWG